MELDGFGDEFVFMQGEGSDGWNIHHELEIAVRKLEDRSVEADNLRSLLQELEPKRIELERALSEMAILDWRLAEADRELRDCKSELEVTVGVVWGAAGGRTPRFLRVTSRGRGRD